MHRGLKQGVCVKNMIDCAYYAQSIMFKKHDRLCVLRTIYHVFFTQFYYHFN